MALPQRLPIKAPVKTDPGYPAAFQPTIGDSRAPNKPLERKAAILFNSQQTIEIPLMTFLGDQVIGAGQDVTIDVQGQMGNRCSGFILASIVGTVQIAINGGGLRSVPSAMVLNGGQINQIRIITAALSGCVLQLNGV